MRVLFVGYDEVPKYLPDEEFSQWPFEEWDEEKEPLWIRNCPSLFDYNILMLNSECRIPTRIDNELSNFLGDGGVLCIFISKKNAALLKNYIDINTKTEGFEILPIDSKHWLWKIIKKGKYGFQWLAILRIGIYLSSSLALRKMTDTFAKMYGKEDESLDIQYYEEIAITPNRKCVSLIASVFEGKIIAIPFPCNAIADLLRDILDGIKLNIIESKSKDVVAPKWIDEIRIPNETKALGKINRHKQYLEKGLKELESIIRPKRILFLTGTEISEEVSKILVQMGFRVHLQEEQKRQDIEIRYKEFRGVVEVKGLSKHATVDDLRELLDWWIEYTKEEPKAKGIFIVNHYRTQEPKLRKESYTQHAIDLGKNNKFCLMTTVDLFDVYCDYIKRGIDTEAVVGLIENTNGKLCYESSE